MGLESAGERVQRMLARLDLRFDNLETVPPQQAREPDQSLQLDKHGPVSTAEGAEQAVQYVNRRERHVAGENEVQVGATASQGGIDPAERAAGRDGVAANDPDPRGEIQPACRGPEELDPSLSLPAQSRFIATHARAASAGEDGHAEAWS